MDIYKPNSRYRNFHYATARNKPKVKIHNIDFNDQELDTMIKIIDLGLSEIQRTFKRFNDSDYDLKEIYWYYRFNSNQIRKKLEKIRGF